MDTFPWMAAIGGGALLLLTAGLVALWWMRRTPEPEPLPTEWALTARPVFTTDERRVHKLLREALPQHIVLAKLPLVRFCQPVDPMDVKFWFRLLGATHVTFAVCSANGRVLAAVDLEHDRSNSRRILQMKQSVLGACRVRYLRCPVDNLPSPTELQLLVPSATARSGLTASNAGLDEARDSLSSTVASRRAQRNQLWQDSSTFQDSFFAPDSRLDGFGASEYGALSPEMASRIGTTLGSSRFDADHDRDRDRDRDGDGGGVVVDGAAPPPRVSQR